MNEQPYELRVRDVMTKPVVIVSPEDSLHSCIARMSENRVYALPVVDRHEKCRGIISSSDILQVTRDLDDDLHEMQKADAATGKWMLAQIREEVGNRKVSDIMNEDVATVHKDTRIAKAARDMLRNGVHRLPVIDAHNRVVGIVSTSDILAAFVDGESEE